MGKADAGLRRIFHEHLPEFDFTAVESGSTSRGIPDTNGCFDGTEFWVELKAADHWRIVVRPEQVGWIERRITHGGRVFIAVRRADTELWLYRGSAIRALLSERLDAVPELGRWHGGPVFWDWAAVRCLLMSR